MSEKRLRLGKRGTVRITLRPGQPTRIESIDLVGDLWQDYLDELSAAKDAAVKDDRRLQNRCLREALRSLLSHMDGVICGLDAALSQAQIGYMPQNGRCLREKAADLRAFAKNRKRRDPGALPLRLKALRDIVSHPTTTKEDPTERTKVLIPRDLYESTPDIIERQGTLISGWLDRVCAAFGFPRVVDTKALVEQFGAVIGGTQHTQQI